MKNIKNMLFSLFVSFIITLSSSTKATPTMDYEHFFETFIEIDATVQPYTARFTTNSHSTVCSFLEMMSNDTRECLSKEKQDLYTTISKTNDFISLNQLIEVLQDIHHYLNNSSHQTDHVTINNVNTVTNGQIVTQNMVQIIHYIDEELERCCKKLSTDFETTWAILADLNSTINSCCDDISTTIEDLSDAVTSDLQTTWSILEACSITAIFTPTTITAPGTYCLSNDITGPIVIAANNVTLDLNHHTISQTTNGIIINSLQTNILVKNGTISSTTLEGILVQQGAQEITLRTIELINCGSAATPFAAHLQGVTASHVANCILDRVNVYNSPSGILLENADSCLVQNCIVSSCGNIPLVTGFGILGTSITATASSNQFINCTVEDCVSTSTMAGFLFQYAADTVCKNCLVDNIQALNVTGGIRIVNSYNTLVSDATINSVSITTTADQHLLVIFTQSIYYCAGIEINSSAANTLKNITMRNIGSTSVVVQDNFGIYFNSSSGSPVATNFPSLVGKNIIIDTINPSFTHLVGIGASLFTHPGSIFLDDCTINTISGGTFVDGITLGVSNVAIIKNSSVMNTIATGPITGITRGFNITTGGALASATLIDNCQASALTGGLTAIGFNIGSSNTIINNSLASYINVTNATPAGQTSAGFFISGSNTTLNNCIADSITSAVSATGHGFVSTSGASLSSCQAIRCPNGSGIRVTGNGSLINACIATNSSIGIQNTAGASAVIINCIAHNNTTNYSGILPAPGSALTPGSLPMLGANLAA